MKKFDIGFTYTAHGSVEILADTVEEAENQAEAFLEALKESGTLASGARDYQTISWDSDEVEVI